MALKQNITKLYLLQSRNFFNGHQCPYMFLNLPAINSTILQHNILKFPFLDCSVQTGHAAPLHNEQPDLKQLFENHSKNVPQLIDSTIRCVL